MTDQVIDISQIRLDPDNANRGNPNGAALLRRSLLKNGAGRGVLLDKDFTAIAGNQVLKAFREAGFTKIRVVQAAPDELVATMRPDVEIDTPVGRQMALDDNGIGQASLELDPEVIRRQAARFNLQLEDAAISPAQLDAMRQAAAEPAQPEPGEMDASGSAGVEGAQSISGAAPTGERSPTLADRFVVPPFTVLDSRQGYWQERKRYWMQMGLRDGDGRDVADNVPPARTMTPGDIKSDGWLSTQTGLSQFDPVLAEIICRWFARPGDTVLDVCAGGPTRGVVAHKCGLQYIGIEPRPEQIDANRLQAERMLTDSPPSYMQGFAQSLLRHPDLFGPCDLFFTCPPYWDLERYTDDPRDLSAMDWPDFSFTWMDIIQRGVALLRPDRFAVVVIGEVRSTGDSGPGHPRGTLAGLVNATVTAMEVAGAFLYNDAIFLTPVGSLAVRVGSGFQQSRILGRCHQNVLIFFKGDPATIRQNYPATVGAADLTVDPSEVAHGV
jgi:hypothetical protein